MNLDLWKRDFLHVWRASRRTVMLHTLLVFALCLPFFAVFAVSPVLGTLLFLFLIVACVLWWAQVHVAAYEAAREPDVRIGFFDRTEAVKKNWLALLLGYGLWVLLYMVGSVLVLPAIVILAVLMPYLLFIALEGKGPIEALEANVRLAGDRLAEIVVAWMLLAVGMTAVVVPIIAVLMVGIFWAESAQNDAILWGTLALMMPVVLGLSVVSHSIQVAAGVTAYRVLRGQTVDAIDASEFAMAGAVAASREVDAVVW